MHREFFAPLQEFESNLEQGRFNVLGFKYFRARFCQCAFVVVLSSKNLPFLISRKESAFMKQGHLLNNCAAVCLHEETQNTRQ